MGNTHITMTQYTYLNLSSWVCVGWFNKFLFQNTLSNYKILFKISTIPVYHYLWCIIIHIQFLITFHNSLKNFIKYDDCSINTLLSLPINFFLICTKSVIQFGKLLKTFILINNKYLFDTVASLLVRHMDTSHFL